MRSAHIAYLIIGLVAAFAAGMLGMEAYKLASNGRLVATSIGGIGGSLAYLAFVFGRMGTSNFKL